MSTLPRILREEALLPSIDHSGASRAATAKDGDSARKSRPVPTFWNFAEDGPIDDHFANSNRHQPMRHHA